ncbi:MAG: PepSY domain-containing protein [Pyrinomonadaceae bacterium]
MKTILTFVAATLLLTASVSVFGATRKGTEGKVRKSAAKITMKQARTTALAQVPGGRIKSSELEREDGKLLYSFDIRAGKGIKEVHVDAMTGEVLGVKDESPANEAKERRDERNEHKKSHP